MMSKQVAIADPPMVKGFLRPHLSIQICAGIVHIIRTRPVTPEAKKEARAEARLAFWKMSGAK